MRTGLFLATWIVVAAGAAGCGSDEPSVVNGAGGGGASAGSAGLGGTSGQGGGAGGAAGQAVGGEGGAAGSAGASGVAGAAGGPCSGTCRPLEQCFNDKYCVAKLVPVTGGYSIDATEVTRDQYSAWISTNPSPTSGQPNRCALNNDFHAEAECMNLDSVCKGSSCGNFPQVCVDWCDAYAYCKAVGKRLCGRIGGGANEYGDYADPSKSQWFNACSSGGQNDYPYGDTYDGQKCNGYDNAKTGCKSGSCSLVEVATLGECSSAAAGYSGIYDLSGNAWEWEDSCASECHTNGGSPSLYAFDVYRCDFGAEQDYESHTSHTGFRCCSDP